MTYFSSDWHFDHERSLRFHARKAFKTHKELEDIILSRALDTMRPGDNMYFLGDLGWKLTKQSLDAIFNGFKKKKINFHWILGNHDKIPQGYHHKALCFVGPSKMIFVDKQAIFLSHYPYLVWDKSHFGSWNLHGHIHVEDSTWNKALVRDYSNGKQMNVNIETQGEWRPYSFDDIVKKMELLPDNWDLIRKGDEQT